MSKFIQDDTTYEVSQLWKNLNKKQRIEKIQSVINSIEKYKIINIQEVYNNGQIIFRIEESIPANERGLFLLEFEEELKKEIDQGLTVWLEPVGDKSKLRQLRGVEVKI